MAGIFASKTLSFSLLFTTFTLTSAAPNYHVGVSRLQRRQLSIPTDLPGNWTSLGCYTEGSAGRALTGANYVDGAKMTAEACIAFCDDKGFAYAGTEYSAECYCGNTLGSGSVKAPAGDCGMACSGDATEACGGPNRLTLFNSGAVAGPGPVHNPGPAGWSLLGCYVDQGVRTLGVGTGVPGGGGKLTVALCTTACKAGNFKYAGVEYSGECYCDNAIRPPGGPAPDDFAGCNMLCNGNSSEYCGGPNRLDLYSFGGGPSSTVTVIEQTATDTGPTATGPGTGPTTTPTNTPPPTTGLPTGWSYKGCYVDNLNGRILINQQPDSPTLTVEKCITACVGAGYSVAGMEYSSQCFCGNSLINGGELADSDSQCNMVCAGDLREMCGAGNRMSIYAKGDLTVFQPPAVQTEDLPGSWEYQACITDNNPDRVFFWPIIDYENTTATSCLSICSEYGYMAAGIEYGGECYCGDPANVAQHGGQTRPDSECNTVCPGDAHYLCGGGNRLSYYKWTGTPLYSWKFATGNAAGKYEQLVGGVVIPLITTNGVNGKYTFLEKHGTGAPNTTGAYELDLSNINDLSMTWREMHVKTDIFCAAGLTLPDRVGRQINIGGWSGDSTFGIRLYWPDGSPGKPSTRDWQENVNELSLIDGRWYPSAMIMTNGSILVVGGQVGSNGAPVPTLEVLPKPAGGYAKYADYLERTDPNNLYPYLAVLPSGGILVVYHNEARILDARTLDTIKMLPLIPGSPVDSLSGRTYPYEGTAVLLPQHAPYSDPLEILICGGSGPGAGRALDNCVLTAPDAPNPTWTLERMPSQRVMPCIAALPDGTYLIANGAHAGVAGFGLATDPNLNAILYDPSKPVHSRFTVMANTTVARLYHSEAMTMNDGRVMISGSDPQDGTHPEEYRVEVFTPPYLLSGLPRPKFTLQNRDWSYGQRVTFTLQAGNPANIRVSLLGTVASTHGNSMGQRTIFPAVSCSGTTCTVTAPPGVNVCPPGWFQVFVLDGPTPSEAVYVRIGGDPAGLGGWPDFEDFDVPGEGPVVVGL